MSKTVTVVTCDLFQSRKYSTKQRKEISILLKREFSVVSKTYKNAIHTPASFNVTVGDEFQFVLSQAEKAYEVAVFYRALLALADLTPRLEFRASLGIGEIAVENRSDSYSQDGTAFHRSRQGMNKFQNQKSKGKRRTEIITGEDTLDGTLDMILMYQDLLEEKWTRAQWEAVRWRLVQPTYEEIAGRLGIAYQNVHKRLRAANWGVFNQGLQFIERSLKTHLLKGER